MRAHLFSALGTLKIGLDILFEQERVKIDKVLVTVGSSKPRKWSKDYGGGDECSVSVMETAARAVHGDCVACLLYDP